MEYDSGEPAVILHRFGAGQAIYISANVGAGWVHNPYPPLMRFVAHLVRRCRPPIEIDAPQAIEVTASRRPSGELMVHLLNNPVPMVPLDLFVDAYNPKAREVLTTFLFPQEVNPIHNITVRFHDFGVKSARLPLQDRSLEVTGEPGTVVVPQVKLHEVLLAEVEG